MARRRRTSKGRFTRRRTRHVSTRRISMVRHLFRRHRRHSRKHTRRAPARESTLSKLVVPAVLIMSAVSSIGAKDKGDINSAPDLPSKMKTVGNMLLGRTFGFNPFTSAKQYSDSFNPAGWANRYTGAGLLATFLYPKIPGVPHKALVRKAGGAAILGGFLGIFDPPDSGGAMFSAQQRGLNTGTSGNASGVSSGSPF